MVKISRRNFITGSALLIAAPAIVKIANIMPVRNRIITPNAYYGEKRFPGYNGPIARYRSPDGKEFDIYSFNDWTIQQPGGHIITLYNQAGNYHHADWKGK